MRVGEVLPIEGSIMLNQDKETQCIMVSNTGDRPVQVGSHYHFYEVNRLLVFTREKTKGYHLDIPSGTSVRFEPGEEKQVQLVKNGGRGGQAG